MVAELEGLLDETQAESVDIQSSLINCTEKQDVNEERSSEEQLRVRRVSVSSLEDPSMDGESLQQPPDSPNTWMSDLVREDLYGSLIPHHSGLSHKL